MVTVDGDYYRRRSEVPAATFAVAHPSGCRRHLPFTGSWVTTGLLPGPPFASQNSRGYFRRPSARGPSSSRNHVHRFDLRKLIWCHLKRLTGTKRLCGQVLCRLKRFLVHGIVARGQRMEINGAGKSL